MTRSLLASAVRWLAVSTVSAWSLYRSAQSVVGYLHSADACSYIASWRSAARDAPAGRGGVLCDDAECISPTDRSRMIMTLWERAPVTTIPIRGDGDLADIDCVFSSAWHTASAGEKLKAHGFTVVSTNEYVKTWCRERTGARQSSAKKAVISPLWEFLVLIIELAMMWLIAVLVSGIGRCSLASLASALFVGAILGLAALSHPLLPPNGLGTYGGKAKLFYEGVDVAWRFLSSPGGAVLQPAYPPGLTMLAYLHFMASGGCGDGMVQLMVVFAVVILGLVIVRGSSHRWDCIPMAVYCLAPISIRMSAGFYAEPFAALLLLAGWRVLRERGSAAGALLMGVAGLFRIEAGVVALIFSISACVLSNRRRLLPMSTLCSVVPAIGWCAVCRLAGFGGLADWNVMSVPRAGQMWYALKAVMSALWTQVVPAALTAACIVRPVLWSGMRRGLFAAVVVVVGMVVACGFYAAPYAKWMMDNTIPRLVWYVSVIPFGELMGARKADSPGSSTGRLQRPVGGR